MNVDRPILVIGATRGTGREIVSRLLRYGHPVRALARDVSSAKLALPREIDIMEGDVTKPATLPEALDGVSNVIFTAGVTKRPASEQSIVAVEYHGVTNTLSAAKATAFAGRFLYMTAIGVTRHSLESIGLNLIKGNTMKWRRLAEEEIQRSKLDYAIVRCGVLTNADTKRAVELSQRNYRMSFLRRISRSAAAEVFVQTLRHPDVHRTTFEALWSARTEPVSWDTLFARLKPDPAIERGSVAE